MIRPWGIDEDRLPAHAMSKRCGCASCEGGRAGEKLGKAVAKIIIAAIDKANRKKKPLKRSRGDSSRG